MRSSVEYEKGFITSGPGLDVNLGERSPVYA